MVSKDTKGLEVKAGDEIAIKAQGMVVTGTVYDANYYERDGGWYIEVSPANVGYSYWKQSYDGGRIIRLNGKEISAEQTSGPEELKR
jgi:hypothetical protein